MRSTQAALDWTPTPTDSIGPQAHQQANRKTKQTATMALDQVNTNLHLGQTIWKRSPYYRHRLHLHLPL
jgi:hypothetical protein